MGLWGASGGGGGKGGWLVLVGKGGRESKFLGHEATFIEERGGWYKSRLRQVYYHNPRPSPPPPHTKTKTIVGLDPCKTYIIPQEEGTWF